VRLRLRPDSGQKRTTKSARRTGRSPRHRRWMADLARRPCVAGLLWQYD